MPSTAVCVPSSASIVIDLFEHRDHHVETFDREGLLRHELLAEVALHRLDLRETLQHLHFALRRELAAVHPPSMYSRSHSRCSTFEMCSIS